MLIPKSDGLNKTRHCEEPTGDAAISSRASALSTGLLRYARNDEPLFGLKNFADATLGGVAQAARPGSVY
jgi:hypothetical protein